ncbi:MAG: class I SAM-dependent methyltransferase [Spirochaetia bacterium]|nr:class I SAM-dependent methyltransferase [Spirochaetia bacterium]
MFVYARVGKLRHRDFLLGLYHFRGDEKVLDVGTGAGLLAVGAAKKVPDGKVIGIDIWNVDDLSNNSKARAVENVQIEGVARRVEVLREDARKLSFPDQSFDLVVSNLCLHNIEEEKGREEACLEIARVLKTGGVALISDFSRTAEYQKIFQKAGLLVDKKRSPWFKTLAFPPMTILRAQKAPAVS